MSNLSFTPIPKLLCVLCFISGCASAPDLAFVEKSFDHGSVGVGATAPSPELAKSEFGQLVRSAVQNSPSNARSASRYDLAVADRNSARGAFLPRVSMGINARSERLDSDIAGVTPFVRISQLVYDGGAASGELTAAKARVLESRGDQLQTAAAIALTAIQAYVSVINQREIQRISLQNVVVHEDITRQITERFEQGAGSNADVLTAQSRMADAQTRFADARARTDRAEAQFHEVFGHEPGTLSPAIEAPSVPRTDAQIIANSPQVRRADASLLAAKSQQSAAIARRQPDVEIAAFTDRDDDNDANFGVDLSFNYELDSTGQRKAAIASAEAQIKEAEFAREDLVRQLRRELEFVRSDQMAGAERLQAARIAATVNADSVKAARAQFTIGRRSLIEILDAQRDFVNAQELLILAEQSFFLTNYAVLSLTGDILDLLGIQTFEHGAHQ